LIFSKTSGARHENAGPPCKANPAITENKMYLEKTANCVKHNPIRAELAWSDHATALGILARGGNPIISLCRKLLEAGHDAATPLEAWRGGTLCLRVRSIGEAAGLETSSKGTGFIRTPAVRIGPPVAQNASGDTEWLDWPPDEGAP
jgi:hypothetical protein